jgi:hypothetical protein
LFSFEKLSYSGLVISWLQKENNSKEDCALSKWLFLWWQFRAHFKNNWMINDSLKVCHTGSVNYIAIVRTSIWKAKLPLYLTKLQDMKVYEAVLI